MSTACLVAHNAKCHPSSPAPVAPDMAQPFNSPEPEPVSVTSAYNDGENDPEHLESTLTTDGDDMDEQRQPSVHSQAFVRHGVDMAVMSASGFCTKGRMKMLLRLPAEEVRSTAADSARQLLSICCGSSSAPRQ